MDSKELRRIMGHFATGVTVVTTKDAAAVGDVVNAKGTVRTDVNLGSGYTYAVIIEDASLRK